jgi:uncharacterized protein
MDCGIYIKIHKSYRWVVALCDDDLIGKTLEEGKFYLNISEGFFKGEKYDYRKLKSLIYDCLREDATFYIIGKNAVNICMELGIVQREGISKINGIPLSLILL